MPRTSKIYSHSVPASHSAVLANAVPTRKPWLLSWRIRLALLGLIAVALTTLGLRITQDGPVMPHELAGLPLATIEATTAPLAGSASAERTHVNYSYEQSLSASVRAISDIATSTDQDKAISASSRESAPLKRTAPRREMPAGPASHRSSREWTATFFNN